MRSSTRRGKSTCTFAATFSGLFLFLLCRFCLRDPFGGLFCEGCVAIDSQRDRRLEARVRPATDAIQG